MEEREKVAETGNVKIGQDVRIEMGPGPAINGNTKLWIDGVEHPGFVSVTLQLDAGSVAKLTVATYASVIVEGKADVDRVHICPQCRNEIEQRESGPDTLVDTTRHKDAWVRRMVV